MLLYSIVANESARTHDSVYHDGNDNFLFYDNCPNVFRSERKDKYHINII